MSTTAFALEVVRRANWPFAINSQTTDTEVEAETYPLLLAFAGSETLEKP